MSCSLQVKSSYAGLFHDLANWIDDSSLPVDRYGKNKKYKCLRALVNASDNSLLSPYCFLEHLPLTLESVLFCFESCQYIYSPSRLVDFLAYLGVKSSRGKIVSYNHVYTWRLLSIESEFLERKNIYFSDCSTSLKFERKDFLIRQVLSFLDNSNFRSDFLKRLENNDFSGGFENV